MTARRKQFEPKMVYNCRKKMPLPDFGSEIGMFVICSSTHHCFSLHDGWLLDTDDSHPNAVPWSCRDQIGLDGIELAYEIVRIKVSYQRERQREKRANESRKSEIERTSERAREIEKERIRV